jgi:RNA polymerase sigma factor (sigma-70 family)
MKLTDEQILNYCEKFVKQYINTYGEDKLLDKGDALSIAYCAMKESPDYDESRPECEIEAYFRKRVMGELVRTFQNLTKSRLKNKMGTVSIDDVPDESRVGEIKEDKELVLSYCRSKLELHIFKGLFMGKTQREIARETGYTDGRISQIVKDVKTRIRG